MIEKMSREQLMLKESELRTERMRLKLKDHNFYKGEIESFNEKIKKCQEARKLLENFMKN